MLNKFTMCTCIKDYPPTTYHQGPSRQANQCLGQYYYDDDFSRKCRTYGFQFTLTETNFYDTHNYPVMITMFYEYMCCGGVYMRTYDKVVEEGCRLRWVGGGGASDLTSASFAQMLIRIYGRGCRDGGFGSTGRTLLDSQ